MGTDKLTRRALLWCSAAASLKAPNVGAALGKGITIPCALRLAAKHHSNAVPDNIIWMEYKLTEHGAGASN